MNQIIAIIFIVIGIIVFIAVVNHLTRGTLIKSIVAGILFWIPFGAIGSSFTQIINAIPG